MNATVIPDPASLPHGDSTTRQSADSCFRIVTRALETVAKEYRSGCLEAIRKHRPALHEAIKKAEVAVDAAALGGDAQATKKAADAYVAAWERAIAWHRFVTDILALSVDDWCARPDKPTIVLDTPHGEVLLVADRDAYSRAVEDSKVVFSPIEVEQLINGGGRGLVTGDCVRTLIETKRVFPGARLEDVCKPGERREEQTEQQAVPRPRARPSPKKQRQQEPAREKAKPAQTAAKPEAQLSLLDGDVFSRESETKQARAPPRATTGEE